MGRQSRLGGSFSCMEGLTNELLPLLEGFALRQVAVSERNVKITPFEFRVCKSGEEFGRLGRDEEFVVGDEGDYTVFGGVNAIGVSSVFDQLLNVELAGFFHLGPASGHPVENPEASGAFELL